MSELAIAIQSKVSSEAWILMLAPTCYDRVRHASNLAGMTEAFGCLKWDTAKV